MRKRSIDLDNLSLSFVAIINKCRFKDETILIKFKLLATFLEEGTKCHSQPRLISLDSQEQPSIHQSKTLP